MVDSLDALGWYGYLDNRQHLYKVKMDGFSAFNGGFTKLIDASKIDEYPFGRDRLRYLTAKYSNNAKTVRVLIAHELVPQYALGENFQMYVNKKLVKAYPVETFGEKKTYGLFGIDFGLA